MYKNKKVLAIIPARSGSKRVLNKNIKLLAGRPLIYYTIKTALDCKFIDKVIVSTDSAKIAKIANKYGAEVPFLRPKRLAGDNVPDKPVIEHCINFLRQEAEYYDYVLYLKPTAPLRTRNDILNAIKILNEKKLPLVRSVTKVSGIFHPYWMYKGRNDLLHPFIKGVDIKKYFQSQLLPQDIFSLNGVVEAFTTKHALRNDNFIYKANKIGFIEISRERAIDIDTLNDFRFIEYLVKANKIW